MNDIFRAMTRDEEVYQDADSFRPERFLKADGTLNDDTMDYAFGFGRRYVAFTPGLVQNADMICLRAEFALAEPSLRQRYAILSCAQPANSQNDL
jgi:cytochrome P450